MLLLSKYTRNRREIERRRENTINFTLLFLSPEEEIDASVAEKVKALNRAIDIVIYSSVNCRNTLFEQEWVR